MRRTSTLRTVAVSPFRTTSLAAHSLWSSNRNSKKSEPSLRPGILHTAMIQPVPESSSLVTSTTAAPFARLVRLQLAASASKLTTTTVNARETQALSKSWPWQKTATGSSASNARIWPSRLTAVTTSRKFLPQLPSLDRDELTDLRL